MMKSFYIAFFTFILSISLLFGQDFVQQHPTGKLNDLLEIVMDTSGTGLTYGVFGIVLKTEDFGSNWEEILMPNTEFHAMSLVPNTNGQGFLISHGSVFSKTLDAGETWADLDAGLAIEGDFLSMLDLPTDETFYAASTGMIIKSADSGQTWTDISPELGIADWVDLTFVSDTKGWATNLDGQIFMTNDGGQIWSIINETTFANSSVLLDFINEQIGYAGFGNTLYKSTDGGASWTLINADAFQSNVEKLQAITENFIVGTYARNSVAASIDGGVNVSNVVPTPTYYAQNRGISALPDGRIWVASGLHSVNYSNDFGATFIDQLYEPKNILNALDFLDSDIGYAAGHYGSFFKTIDGGQQWDFMPIPMLDGTSRLNTAFHVKTISANEVWLAGGDNIIRTIDGGENFEVNLQIESNFSSFDIHGDHIFALSSSVLYKSIDGGASWTNSMIESSTSLQRAFFYNEMVGYAGGFSGLLMKTIDGGETWTDITSEFTNFTVRKIFFLTEDLGIVLKAGNSNSVLITNDGGQIWSDISFPVSSYWSDARVLGEQHFTITGSISSTGYFIETTDGGATWTTAYSPRIALNNFEVVPTDTGYDYWVCGNGGFIAAAEKLATILNEVEVVSIDVFPNPTKGIIQIKLPNNTEQVDRIEVYDLQGKQVLLKENSSKIDVSALTPGAYFLLIKQENKLYTSKVILG